MVESEAGGASRRSRRRWSTAEKRRIVELTMAPMASVSEVSRAYNVNANQVFKWRRDVERGALRESCTALVPVTVSDGRDNNGSEAEQASRRSTAGAIHIELGGRARISVEHGADACLVQSVLESLRK